jgi:hypothetical protein
MDAAHLARAGRTPCSGKPKDAPFTTANPERNTMPNNWIPTQWQIEVSVTELDNDPLPVTIDRMISPFYDGVRFAVRRGRNVLTVKGKWEFEPMPSSRTDAFYKRCRFKTFDAAVKAADAAATEIQAMHAEWRKHWTEKNETVADHA